MTEQLSNNKLDEKGRTKRTYTWGGSLVGLNNPDSLKKPKLYNHENLPTSMIVQLANSVGEDVANAMDVGMDLTVDNLNELVNSLVNNKTDDNEISNKRLYKFFVKLKQGEVEFEADNLGEFIIEHEPSTEDVLQIRYAPQSVFQVRSVSRCTDTLPGHTEAILHVSYSPDGKHLASGGGDTTVRFWDSNTNLPRYTGKHRNHVLCTAWSPCGHVFMRSGFTFFIIFFNFTQCHHDIIVPIWQVK